MNRSAARADSPTANIGVCATEAKRAKALEQWRRVPRRVAEQAAAGRGRAAAGGTLQRREGGEGSSVGGESSRRCVTKEDEGGRGLSQMEGESVVRAVRM